MPGAQIIDVVNFMPERVVPVRDDLIGDDSPSTAACASAASPLPYYLRGPRHARDATAPRTDGDAPEDVDSCLVLRQGFTADLVWPGDRPASFGAASSGVVEREARG